MRPVPTPALPQAHEGKVNPESMKLATYAACSSASAVPFLILSLSGYVSLPTSSSDAPFQYYMTSLCSFTETFPSISTSWCVCVCVCVCVSSSMTMFSFHQDSFFSSGHVNVFFHFHIKFRFFLWLIHCLFKNNYQFHDNFSLHFHISSSSFQWLRQS